MNTSKRRCGRDLSLDSLFAACKHSLIHTGRPLHHSLTNTVPVLGILWRHHDFDLAGPTIFLPLDRMEHTRPTPSEDPLVYLHRSIRAVRTAS